MKKKIFAYIYHLLKHISTVLHKAVLIGYLIGTKYRENIAIEQYLRNNESKQKNQCIGCKNVVLIVKRDFKKKGRKSKTFFVYLFKIRTCSNLFGYKCFE